MLTICWSVKGGSGTTVVAATMGLLAPRALVVDLAGDLAPTLGLTAHGPGAPDWVRSEAPPDHLADLLVEVEPDTSLMPCSRGERRTDSPPSPRWSELGSWLLGWARDHDGSVVVDAGLGPPVPALLDQADRSLLVTRACYLSLSAAAACPTKPGGVVLIDEPGRCLRRRDIERAVGAPVVSTIDYDPAVARSVDNGLLARHLPGTLRKAGRKTAA